MSENGVSLNFTVWKIILHHFTASLMAYTGECSWWWWRISTYFDVRMESTKTKKAFIVTPKRIEQWFNVIILLVFQENVIVLYFLEGLLYEHHWLFAFATPWTERFGTRAIHIANKKWGASWSYEFFASQPHDSWILVMCFACDFSHDI